MYIFDGRTGVQHDNTGPAAPATFLREAFLAPLEDPQTLSEEADKAVQAFFDEGQSRRHV